MVIQAQKGKDKGFLGRLRKRYDDRALRSQVTHVHGPKKFHLRDNEVALVILGRDVTYHLKKVVEHHRAMGADYLIFVEGGWRLVLDTDELLDFPGADRMHLPDLTQMLTAQGHTAMVCQMLEMVPPGPLYGYQGLSFEHTIKAFNSYSLADIDARDYYSKVTRWHWFMEQNKTTNPDIKIMFGVIRATLFGEECCITKHPLFKMGPEVNPGVHPHVSTGVTCADFSGVLRHYKFSGDYLEREKARIAEQRLKRNEAVLRISRFQEEPDLSFVVPTT